LLFRVQPVYFVKFYVAHLSPSSISIVTKNPLS